MGKSLEMTVSRALSYKACVFLLKKISAGGLFLSVILQDNPPYVDAGVVFSQHMFSLLISFVCYLFGLYSRHEIAAFLLVSGVNKSLTAHSVSDVKK